MSNHPPITWHDDASIATRRHELLTQAQLTINELRTRAANYTLDQHGQAILRELEDLEWLEAGRETA